MNLSKSKFFGILSTLFIALLLLNGKTPTNNSEIKGASDPIKFTEGQVTKVVDGDTIHVFLEGKDQTVRLIGVDSPETKHPTKGKECYGEESSKYLTTLLLHKKVTLEKDKSNVDRYDRLLRYVYMDDLFVNKDIVENGYAISKAYSPDTKHQEVLDLAQNQARENNVGLWSACN